MKSKGYVAGSIMAGFLPAVRIGADMPQPDAGIRDDLETALAGTFQKA